jgi:hypothetical protein
MAERAIGIEPDKGFCWSAMASARYRQGRWQDAHNASKKSLALGGTIIGGPLRSDNGYAIVSGLFGAMSAWQLGVRDEARESYRSAVNSMERVELVTDELIGLRAEAEDLMGLKGRPASPPATSPQLAK